MVRQRAVADKIDRMLRMDEKVEITLFHSFGTRVKKNGEVRLYIDARRLNSQIIPDRKRSTLIEEIMMKFQKVKYINTIDLRSRYWQVPLEEKSRDACSFLFNGRNYSFKRMPMI